MSLEDRALPAAYFSVSDFPSPATAGVPATVTVTARNIDGSIDSMYWSGIRFSSSDQWASLPGTSYLTNGVGYFTVGFHTAGTQSITVRGAANSAITGSQNGIVVNPAATAHFDVSGFPTPTMGGVAHNVTVKAVDDFGNLNPTYAGTVHFASSDPLAVVPVDSTLTNGVGTFSLTLRTAGVQTFTATDTLSTAITGQLSNMPQTLPVYTQTPNPAGGRDKSAWYAPDGLDNDQYIWDSFVLSSDEIINRLDWRGCYTHYLSGAGLSPVYDFTISIFSSIAAGSQPDVSSTPLLRYHTNNNAGETAVGTFGGVIMYDYSSTLPTGFRAIAGTKYWVEIVASQGLTPNYSWPPDWSLAYATGTGSHFRGIGGTGLYYQTISGDIAFTLVTTNNGPGTVVNPGPPIVNSVIVNGGAAQRSTVTQIDVAFSEMVSFPAGINSAFQLNRTGPGGPTGTVSVNAAQSDNVVTLTFAAGGAVGIDPAGSLIDGSYRLTVDATKVQGVGGLLDGNGDGIGGDNYQTPTSGANRIHRLFGDADGDGDVDVSDFGLFRSAFGTADAMFDFDGDGDVDTGDFAQFRQRFGSVMA